MNKPLVMEDKLRLSTSFKIVTLVLVILGLASMIYGFITHPGRAWASYLLNNYYFLSIAIGGTFWLALQSISQAGWSSAFKRVPEAMSLYIPVSAVFFLLLIFGFHSLYHWSHHDAVESDPLLQHKAPYLNVPFFYARITIFFAVWILMVWLMRRTSLREDQVGGMDSFYRFELYSKLFIFILALTFSLGSFDWIMSIDAHWYSTLFALKNFVAAFYHGSTIVVLIVLVLHWKGHFPFLNKSHMVDFSRYVFMLAVVWGYFWFAQFMLIWYGNIPEETVYYAVRWEQPYRSLFFAEIIINWFIPFALLMPRRPSESKLLVFIIILVLVCGQYIDLYMQIMPGTVGKASLGLVELGSWIGYAGLFALVVGWALQQANLIPKNHPYLEESIEHHT